MIRTMTAGELRGQGMDLEPCIPNPATAQVEITTVVPRGSLMSRTTYRVVSAWSWQNEWDEKWNAPPILGAAGKQKLLDLLTKKDEEAIPPVIPPEDAKNN